MPIYIPPRGGSTSTDDLTGSFYTQAQSDARFVHLFGNESVAGEKTFTDDMTIDANLEITGAITENLKIEDNIITLNFGETGAGITLGTAGIEIDRGTAPDGYLVLAENTLGSDSDNRWMLDIGDGNMKKVLYDDFPDTANFLGDLRTNSDFYITSLAPASSGNFLTWDADGKLVDSGENASTLVDDLSGSFVLKNGDTMTGQLQVNDDFTHAENSDGLVHIHNTGTGSDGTNIALYLETDGDSSALQVIGNGNVNKAVMNLRHNAAASSAADGKVFAVGVDGEVFARTQFYSDGSIGIGPGGSTRDVFIFRDDVNTIGIADDAWSPVGGNLHVYGDLEIDDVAQIKDSLSVSNTGTNSSSDAGVHIDRPSLNGAGTVGGIVLSQGSISDRRLYLTGNDSGFSFNIGSYSTNNGDLQLSNGQVAVAAEFRMGPEGQRVMRNNDSQCGFAIEVDTDLSAHAANTDTDAYHTYMRTQDGGPLSVASGTNGGDLVLTLGSGIGDGVDGRFVLRSANSTQDSNMVEGYTAVTSAGQVLDTFTHDSTFGSAEWLVSLNDGTVTRSSKVVATFNSTSVDYIEYGIVEIGGSYTGATLSVANNGASHELLLTVTSGTHNVKVSGRVLK